MENLKNIAEIAQKLEGYMDIHSIAFSQKILDSVEHGKDFNHIMFVKKVRGVYFYTCKSTFESIVINKSNSKLPTYVAHEGSKSLYEIK